jgi:hypothetical protein
MERYLQLLRAFLSSSGAYFVCCLRQARTRDGSPLARLRGKSAGVKTPTTAKLSYSLAGLSIISNMHILSLELGAHFHSENCDH